MKTSWIKGALAVLLIFVVGFKTDDIIELKQYLNGRSGANFLASTKNVKYVVPKGTRAKVSEVKNFYSGNSGLKVEILSGPKAGESVWLYFNKNNPGMKLYEGAEALPEDKPARDLASAKSVETTRDHEGIKAGGVEGDKEISKANFDALDEKAKPKKLSKAEFDTLNKKIEKGQKGLKKMDTNCDNCPLQSVYSAGDVQGMDAPFLQEPLNPENNTGLRDAKEAIPTDARCGPKWVAPEECRKLQKDRPVANYFQFTYLGDKDVSAYLISNRGKDPKTGEMMKVGRDWTFKFEGQALQDTHVMVTDDQKRDSVYFMFPRVTIPHVREEDGRLIATLPTGETASYDAVTKKLIKGVLKETDAKGTGNVAYSGTGLVIRLDGKIGGSGNFEDPRRTADKAIVVKNGKTCKVPVKDLFPDQNQGSALHFKYKKDAPLKQYLLKACGKDFNF